MKSLISLLFFTFLNYPLFSQRSDSVILKPGVGIDNIILMKTSRASVRHYRNYKFSVEKGSGSACGFYTRTHKTFTRRLRIIRYKNDSLGITFEFESEFKNRVFKYFHKCRLDMITLTKMPISTNKITIGKTTREEIIKLYGSLPEDQKDKEYLDYELKGIAFTFSENSILTKIEILAPKSIDQINAF